MFHLNFTKLLVAWAIETVSAFRPSRFRRIQITQKPRPIGVVEVSLIEDDRSVFKPKL